MGMLLQIRFPNGTTVIQETNHENTPRLENTMDFNKRGPRIIQKAEGGVHETKGPSVIPLHVNADASLGVGANIAFEADVGCDLDFDGGVAGP